MIGLKRIKRYCRDDISKIENYEQAINDTETWVCHHRLGLTLDGEKACTKEDLIRFGMYYNRPYFELIFLPKKEHDALHSKARTEELCLITKEKIKGKPFTEEHKQRIREALKKAWSENRHVIKDKETWKQKLSESGKIAKRNRDSKGKYTIQTN